MTPTVEGPNADMFVKTLAYIEAHPEQHDQNDWTPDECGTAMCFAGHAALTIGGLNLIGTSQQVKYDGRTMHVSDAAAYLLGISWKYDDGNEYSKAGRLFYVAQTLDDLYRISADILGLDEQVLRDKVAAEVAS